MECLHDILDVEPSHDRNPRQPYRLPASVSRRRRRRPVVHRRPMAERLPVSRLRLATVPSCNARDLGNFAVRSTNATATGPMSSATGPPMKFSPGSTPRSATSRVACSAPPNLSRRVRLSLQSPPKSPRCIPAPVPAGSARQTSPLLHLDQTGTTCISSSRYIILQRIWFGIGHLPPTAISVAHNYISFVFR